MISVSFYNAEFDKGVRFPGESGKPVQIIVKGHAEFAEKGRDIVCSAVSALIQTLVLSIGRLTPYKQTVVNEKGFLKTEFIPDQQSNDDKKALIILLDSFLIGIFEIEKLYPDYITIEFLNR